MIEFFQMLQRYFSYSFVVTAFIIVLLIALCSSVLGVTLVLKRFSFIGDGLSHIAFGTYAVACAVGLTTSNNMLITMPVTVAAAVLLFIVGQNRRINGDAALAMVSVGALAFGYMVMKIWPPSGNVSADVCNTLFGSTELLARTTTDIPLAAAGTAVVLIVFWLFYHKIFAVTFDENFAKATGINVVWYNLAIAVITAIVIVLAMELVGALLISALIIFPALSAMRAFKSFKGVTVCSVVLSVACAAVGFIVSIPASTPVGSTIVVTDIVAFLLFSGVSYIVRKAKKKA